MKTPPDYQTTLQITKLLREIEILKSVFSLIPINPQIITNIRRASFLKSSLYSARIEGNPLELSDVTNATFTPSSSMKKREVANILHALTFIYEESPQKMSQDFLKILHRIVLTDISPDAGIFSTEVSAIFNNAGVAMYMTTTPQKIAELVGNWCNWTNASNEPGPVKAALAHYWFEKIHPFLDGNGRVGRLVISWIHIHSNFDFGGLVAIEEYIDEHRQDYYDGLNTSGNNITAFVEFFLTAFVVQVQKALKLIKNPPPQTQSNLLPRRQEIVDTIKDHTLVSFDMLWRRFQKVPKSTLHNDLKQLIKGNHIKKLGTTRGVVYTLE